MLWKHDPPGKGMFTQLFRVHTNLCFQNWSGEKHEELEAAATVKKARTEQSLIRRPRIEIIDMIC